MIWALAGIPIGPAALGPGMTVTSVHDTRLDLQLDVTLLGNSFERDVIRRHHQESTVSDGPDGLQVSWAANRHVALEPGHAHDRVLPVVGHTYRSHHGEIVRLDGQPVSIEEAAIVTQVQLPEQLRAIRAMLGDDPAPGTVLPAGEMFAGLLADAPGAPSLREGTLRIDRIEGKLAHVAVDLQLRSQGVDAKGTTITTDATATGWLVVDVPSGLTRRFALEGRIEVLAERRDLHTTGRGTFSSVTELSW